MAQCCTPQDCTSGVRKNLLLLLTLLAIIVGVALGIGLRQVDLGYDGLAWINIWGELFMNMLKAIILPLVATCLITGITSIDPSSAGRLGGVTFIYVFTTNLLGAVIGVLIATAIRPGTSMSQESGHDLQYTSYTDIFQDLLRNLFPSNVVRMTFQSTYTDHDVTWKDIAKNDTANYTSEFVIDSVTRSLEYRYALNTIGLVIVSLAVGLGANAAGEAAEPFIKLITATYAIVEKILFAIFWFSPVGICSLIAGALASVDDLQQVLISLGMFVATFVACFLIHALFIIPGLYLLICRKNPLRYYVAIMDGVLAAFATSSMSASLPYLLESTKNKIGIRPELANFVLPLEVTTNKDGSVMFITCTSVFVAQVYGIELSVADYFVIILLTFLMALTVAMVPSSSIVIIIVVCTAVQIPIQDMVGILMVTEFLLDRLRTCNNVLSTGFGCAIIQHFCPSKQEDQEFHKLSKVGTCCDQENEIDNFVV